MNTNQGSTPEGRVAIVTGATGGLGRVVARRFAEGGARLALFDLSSDRLDSLGDELGMPDGRVLLSATDLSDPQVAQAAADEVMAEFGRADILVNLIGGFLGGKGVVDVAADDISGMLKQHVWTALHVAQAFVPHLVANGWGRVVVVSSPSALSPRGGNVAYAIGKAGGEVLTLSLAQELKGTGVTANIVLVRKIDVERQRDRQPTAENATWTTPEEIAASIMYLCSEDGGAVNGARIPLYGGS